MISVSEAEKIVFKSQRKYGWEVVPFRESLGRILAEDIYADRDLPPYDRVTMDGMAIRYSEYEGGKRSFDIARTQAAGDIPSPIYEAGKAVEIMTGAAIPDGLDTIVRYEDIQIQNGRGEIQTDTIQRGQNIHRKGSDKKAGQVLASAGKLINGNTLALAAACGYSKLKVKKVPKIALFSSGDEIVGVEDKPEPQQIRQSNIYAMEAMLKAHHCTPALFSLKDDQAQITTELKQMAREHDVLIMTGGVSKGKFDFIPNVLAEIGIEKHFHRVAQKPGKPFWFGSSDKLIVFALPGNPVSTVHCMNRFVIPWLQKSMDVVPSDPISVQLAESVTFKKPLTYFVQCALDTNMEGTCIATPVPDNGSGDFSSLAYADGFIELPADQDVHPAGEVYPFYRWR